MNLIMINKNRHCFSGDQTIAKSWMSYKKGFLLS